MPRGAAGPPEERQILSNRPIGFFDSYQPKNGRLAADERRLTQMHHVIDAPRPFTLLLGCEYR
ncbi:MAG TPA: hypothetical protein VN277_06685, partial [Acidiferrobacterales bacterium]|nr:hypothetical protein [Acidiferrobacterales bacterium]